MLDRIESAAARIRGLRLGRHFGRVSAIRAGVVEVDGLSHSASVGDRVGFLNGTLFGEVVGLSPDHALVLPEGPTDGLSIGAGVELLFGCSSFLGTDAAGYEDAFAMLRERHLAPKRWLPRVKAPKVFRFARALKLRKPDPRAAMAEMPPLLRSYLAMGGWVSDHAVVDSQMDTLHVFTGLEISAIPPGRARLLRAAGA